MVVETLRLWDPLVRLFHWSLAGVFIANYFLNEPGESWHVWLGYYALAWIPVRVLWGFVGSPAARWSDFWPTRVRLAEHLRALIAWRPYHRLGHSPVGALVMILMMLCMFALGVSGFMMDRIDYFWGVDWVEDLHGLVADALLVLVCLHLLAALVESVRLHENLPLSMITGRRRKL